MLDADLKAAMLVEPAGLAGHRPSALHGHAILVLQKRDVEGRDYRVYGGCKYKL